MKLIVGILLATLAIAQTNQPAQIVGGIIGAPVPSMQVRTAYIGMSLFGPTIKNAPYSATEIMERVQTLADGTRISQPAQKTIYYRDSAGRTRIERTFATPPGFPPRTGPSMIEINDPVAGTHYSLTPDHKARQQFVSPPPPPRPPPPVSAGSAGVSPSVVVTSPASAMWFTTNSTLRSVNQPQFSNEALGRQTIEGLLTDGVRNTTTYPIDSIGNDRPITTTSETWTSPELQLVVLQKDVDPRTGDNTRKLTNISRSEPDAALFQVPADYEVLPSDQAAPTVPAGPR